MTCSEIAFLFSNVETIFILFFSFALLRAEIFAMHLKRQIESRLSTNSLVTGN